MNDKPARWAELNKTQRKLVEQYIESLLEEQSPLEIAEKPGREVVERRVTGSVCFQLERVKCGKKSCKCAKGELHGPYWYAYWRQDGKVNQSIWEKYYNRLM